MTIADMVAIVVREELRIPMDQIQRTLSHVIFHNATYILNRVEPEDPLGILEEVRNEKEWALSTYREARERFG